MKHSFLYVPGFSTSGSTLVAAEIPAPALLTPQAFPTPKERAACQVLSARQSYGAVAGPSPVAGAATGTGEVLDVGAGTVKRAQGKLELTWQGLTPGKGPSLRAKLRGKKGIL